MKVISMFAGVILCIALTLQRRLLKVQTWQPSYQKACSMSAEDNEAYGLTTGMLDTLPEFSPQDDRSSSPSPGSSPGSASEQSAAFNTAKVGRLSRRATFAPTVIESFDDNTMQPVLFRLPSDPQQSAQQPSVAKQSGVAKQSSVTTQVSMAKQSSFPKQSSLRIQPSIASQASSVSQTSTTRVYSTDQSRPVPLSSGKSIETGRIPAKRSSSTLQSRKSLQSMKTAKVDDLLHDYKFAVERKAKPAEAQAGQHALELDAAMKRLTLEWIVKSFVSLNHTTTSVFGWVNGQSLWPLIERVAAYHVRA